VSTAVWTDNLSEREWKDQTLGGTEEERERERSFIHLLSSLMVKEC
jgi:hypothetical protein